MALLAQIILFVSHKQTHLLGQTKIDEIKANMIWYDLLVRASIHDMSTKSTDVTVKGSLARAASLRHPEYL